jgi:hypothetical protein
MQGAITSIPKIKKTAVFSRTEKKTSALEMKPTIFLEAYNKN